MSFIRSEEHKALVAGIEDLCSRYDDEYWLARDRDGEFPHDFHRDLAQAGWLGIAMPDEYGGAGLGMTEASLMKLSISRHGAWFTVYAAAHQLFFGWDHVGWVGYGRHA